MSTIPTVTREEVLTAKASYIEARRNYSNIHYNFLTTVLKEAGVYKKLVQIKDSELRGQFKVADEPYGISPWTIKFFPVRKTYEGISMKSRNVRDFSPWDERTLVEQLQNICEVVGDLP